MRRGGAGSGSSVPDNRLEIVTNYRAAVVGARSEEPRWRLRRNGASAPLNLSVARTCKSPCPRTLRVDLEGQTAQMRVPPRDPIRQIRWLDPIAHGGAHCPIAHERIQVRSLPWATPAWIP